MIFREMLHVAQSQPLQSKCVHLVPYCATAKFGSQRSASAASFCASVSVSTEERKEVAMAMAMADQSNCRKASWSMGVAMAEREDHPTTTEFIRLWMALVY